MSTAEVEDLVRWTLEHGGYINPALELIADDSIGISFQVRPDTDVIPSDQRLLACPYNLSISCLNALNKDGFSSHSVPFPDRFLRHVTDHTLAVFFLCQQYLLGDDSFWWPYLKALPGPKQEGSLATPLWFSWEDKLWLKGTNLEKASSSREQEWCQQYEAGIACLKENGWDTDDYTWTLALWAATIFSSRSFSSSLILDAPNRGSLEEHEGTERPVLFPLIDLLNHQWSCKIQWSRETTAMALETVEELKPGQRVWNNYGPKGNEELLLGYGFCLVQNPFDQVAVTLKLPFTAAKSAIRERQSSLLSRQNGTAAPSEIHTFYVRDLDGSPTEGYTDNMRALRSFPTELLDIFAIVVANKREMQVLQQRPDLDWSQTSSKGGFLGWRHMFATMSHLKVAVCRKLETITAHDKHLPPTPRNQSQRHAKIYRDGQRAILTAARDRLSQAIRPSTTSSSTSPSSRLITLQGALSILKSLDQPHQRLSYETRFASSLEAILGQSSLEALYEAGWDDGVWILWVCAVRTFGQELRGLGIDGDTDGSEGARRIVTDWLGFVTDTTVYGDPLLARASSSAPASMANDAREGDDANTAANQDLQDLAAELISLVQNASVSAHTFFSSLTSPSSSKLLAKESTTATDQSSAVEDVNSSIDQLVHWATAVIREESLSVLLPSPSSSSSPYSPSPSLSAAHKGGDGGDDEREGDRESNGRVQRLLYLESLHEWRNVAR